MSLDDVAKVTKIQPRILERLEAGKLDGLPAEVFVRGFVRSFARCVGLDESEALRRYASCGLGAGSQDLTPTVRALVEAMVDLAPGASHGPRATPSRMNAVEVIDLAADSARDLPASGVAVETMMLPETGTVAMPAQRAASVAEAMTDSDAHVESVRASAKASALVASEQPDLEASESSAPAERVVQLASAGPSKKKRRRGKGRNKRATNGPAMGMPRTMLATGTPVSASPIVTTPPALEACEVPSPSTSEAAASEAAVHSEASQPAAAELRVAASDELPVTEIWAPKMPPIAAPSVPWRRPAYAAATAPVVPTLVIDDADPDSAERVLEERSETLTPRRSFLPPILLDREDRSARQGGLTLAVIILLIAATLTLSYLMRRPSASGDGMTWLETPASHLG